MAEHRNRERRDSCAEEAGKGSDRYLKQSLKGQWIALAHEWIADHTGCTLLEYFSGVTPLMPKHIRNGNKKTKQTVLAKSALRRLVKAGNVEVVQNRLYCNGCRQRPFMYHDWDEYINGKSTVVINDPDLSTKAKDALRTWVRNRGYKLVGKNTYSKD